MLSRVTDNSPNFICLEEESKLRQEILSLIIYWLEFTIVSICFAFPKKASGHENLGLSSPYMCFCTCKLGTMQIKSILNLEFSF